MKLFKSSSANRDSVEVGLAAMDSVKEGIVVGLVSVLPIVSFGEIDKLTVSFVTIPHPIIFVVTNNDNPAAINFLFTFYPPELFTFS
nr:MAG TPA: hypothetical protein [Caudoviricetes sp.]